MKVYTYHDDRAGITTPELLDLWRTSWSKHGWEPVVLGLDDAKIHFEFEKYFRRIHLYHTVNCRIYEDACYLRWLAMVTVGGGLMTDTDVINYGFKPEDLLAVPRDPGTDNRLLCLESCGVPCVVYGTSEAYNLVVDYIYLYSKFFNPNPYEHLSDMRILWTLKFQIFPRCAEFIRTWKGGDGFKFWYDLPLTHFASEAVMDLGYDRTEKHLVIQEHRPI